MPKPLFSHVLNLRTPQAQTSALANGSVTTAKLAIGASVRTSAFVGVPPGTTISTVGSFVDLVTLPITTSGGIVIVVAAPGWYGTGIAGAPNIILTGIGRNSTTPGVIAGERRFQVPGAGAHIETLPMLVGVDMPPAGAQTYHLVVFNAGAGISVTTGGTWPGFFTAVELA